MAKLFERDKIICEKGKYYVKLANNKKGEEYKLKHLLENDRIFTVGMGKFS